jgi:hypothetical protein
LAHSFVQIAARCISLRTPERLTKPMRALCAIAPVGSGYFNPNSGSPFGRCQLLLPRINNPESKAPQNAVRSALSASDLSVLKRPFLRELISVGRRYKRFPWIALPVDHSHVARTTEDVFLKERFHSHLVALTSCLSNCLGIRHVIERH